MNKSLRVDLENLRARGAALQEIGDEVRQVVERLRAALAEEGRWWGDDEAGRTFGKAYEPDARQALAALQNFSATVNSFGREVVTAAEGMRTVDETGGKQVATAAEPEVRTPPGPGPDLRAEPVRSSDAAAAPSSPGQIPTPVARQAGSQHTGNSDPVPSGEHGHRDPGNDGHSDPIPGGEHRHRDPGNEGSASANPPVGVGNGDRAIGQEGRRPVEPLATSRAGAPSARPVDGPAGSEKKPTPALGPGGPNNSGLPPPAGARPAAVSAPFGRRPPWSEGGISAGPPGGRPPVGGRPDLSAAGPPARDKSAVPARSSAAPRADRDQPGRSAPGSREDSEILRLARQLADRHGVAVSGFGTPGLDEAAAREYLTAVDDVLTKFPVLDLRHVGIATLGARDIARVERLPTGDERAASTWSVTLDAALLADEARLAEVIRAANRTGSVVTQSDTRPVYTATVREFGRAFDLAGAGRARARAQRALIAEYLRDGAHRGAGLARVVRGYKRWRDQLSGGSFDRGRFDSAAALADSFTDVMLNGDRATEPARTLCLLLVDTARRSATRGPANPSAGSPRQVRRTDT